MARLNEIVDRFWGLHFYPDWEDEGESSHRWLQAFSSEDLFELFGSEKFKDVSLHTSAVDCFKPDAFVTWLKTQNEIEKLCIIFDHGTGQRIVEVLNCLGLIASQVTELVLLIHDAKKFARSNDWQNLGVTSFITNFINLKILHFEELKLNTRAVTDLCDVIDGLPHLEKIIFEDFYVTDSQLKKICKSLVEKQTLHTIALNVSDFDIVSFSAIMNLYKFKSGLKKFILQGQDVVSQRYVGVDYS